jgi:signal transduction histidine kinase
MTNMRRRVRTVSIGGTLSITSSPGQGTAVRIELSVPNKPAAP